MIVGTVLFTMVKVWGDIKMEWTKKEIWTVVLFIILVSLFFVNYLGVFFLPRAWVLWVQSL